MSLGRALPQCSVCGERAIYIDRASGRAYCRRHFVERFEARAKENIRRHGMLGKRERIAVGVSGGKDSLALLYFLWKLSKRNPGWEVVAIVVDEGIAGYRERTIENFKRVNARLGVPYRVVSFKESFGYTLDEIIRMSSERGLGVLPCAYCGVFRRYLLNRAAREMGATVLAIAHNADDMAQTFLMNLGSATLERLARLGPVSGVASHEKFVRRIRPFYNIPEKEVALYALLHDLIEPEYNQCPYVVYNVRHKIRGMLNRLEDDFPGFKASLVRSFERLLPVLRERFAPRGEIGTCKICGEPSSHDVCRACTYRLQLGILDSGLLRFHVPAKT
ncbi:MAG: TIGR00269 family protein [Desulfurococcaceae archaeon]